MSSTVVIERTTFGIELTLQEDGAAVPAASLVSVTWELLSEKVGYATNPVKSGTVNAPMANPLVIAIDMTAVDDSAVGSDLLFDAKFTYNSALLGNGAVGRVEPLRVRYRPKRMST